MARIFDQRPPMCSLFYFLRKNPHSSSVRIFFDKVEVDFIESKVSDHSGVEALRTIANKYIENGKKVTLTHLSPDCKAMLLKWNPEFETIIQDAIDDPRYHVVTDMMDTEV